jgi:hypothetical protein
VETVPCATDDNKVEKKKKANNNFFISRVFGLNIRELLMEGTDL